MMTFVLQVDTSDDSMYRKYRYIVFDIDILYHIISSKKYQIFRHIAIFYATCMYFYYCITKITRINRENDKLTEAN